MPRGKRGGKGTWRAGQLEQATLSVSSATDGADAVDDGELSGFIAVCAQQRLDSRDQGIYELPGGDLTARLRICHRPVEADPGSGPTGLPTQRLLDRYHGSPGCGLIDCRADKRTNQTRVRHGLIDGQAHVGRSNVFQRQPPFSLLCGPSARHGSPSTLWAGACASQRR